MTDISFIDSKYSYNGSLGVKLCENSTDFAVWAPEAEAVKLRIYERALSIVGDIIILLL